MSWSIPVLTAFSNFSGAGMERCPWIRSSLVLAALAVAPGCLVTHHSTKVVRENETRRPVQFESDDSQQTFDAGAQAAKGRKDARKGSVFAIPFLLWYSRDEVLSDNAAYNEQVAACDTDGNGMITAHEASTYCARSRGEAATASQSPLVELEHGPARTASLQGMPDMPASGDRGAGSTFDRGPIEDQSPGGGRW